jgi:GT2 family glycosyltransferase
MDVSVIIVNWNSREYLRKCIASVVAHTHATQYEIVVIDSASFDGCGEMLREHYPQVRFIQSSSNLGFAKANNRAFQESVGDAVLFLNPDTELVGPAIDTLYAQLMLLPDAGVVGCTLQNADGSVQASCIQSIPTIVNQFLDSEFLRSKWPCSSLWGMAPLYGPRTEAREVEAISGACLMLARSAFEKVGTFSEDYFMYAEDMDLCDKVRRAGYRNFYIPQATVVHYGGSSSDQIVSTFSAVMMPEAIWRFLRKTRGSVYGLGYRVAMLASAAGRLGVLALSRFVRHDVPRNASWEASWRKWVAVLQWSLKRDGVVNQYYPADRQPSYIR